MENLVLSDKKITNKVTKVPFIDLKRQYLENKEEILDVVDKILSSGTYILGDVVETFERNIARYLECKYVLSVANGTDALILAFKSLNIGPGDEVILPVNSFIATAGAVVAVGAKPVLCDVQDDLNIDVAKIEALINKNTKAIIPVHLTGRPAEMNDILGIAKRYSLFVIEDAAQSIGARYHGKMTGNIGDIGCFSLHPLKNLHVYGDGGLISTNDERLYNEMKILRNHGLINRDICNRFGLNSRLDTLQAGIADYSLKHLEKWNEKRRLTAKCYQSQLKNYFHTPIDKSYEHCVYHNFVVLTEHRDALMSYLLNKGIETKIHYPIPIHLQPACLSLGYKRGDFPMAEKLSQQMLSLPVYSELREEEMQFVIDNICSFYKNKSTT